MKRIKRLILENIKVIFAFILGCLICGGTIYAATLIDSKEVTHVPNDVNWNVNNASDAIDDLYDRTNYGDATASDISSGKTALVNGSKVTGTMPNIANSKVATLTSGDTRPVLQQRRQSLDAKVWAVTNSDNVGRLCYEIPVIGYAPEGTVVGVPYSDIASAIGLTANKIVAGNTILGIAGTGGNARYGAISTSPNGTYTINTGLSSVSHFIIFSQDPSCGVGNTIALYSPSVIGSGYYYGSFNTSGCGGGSPGRKTLGSRDNGLYFVVNSVSGGSISITAPSEANHVGGTSYWFAV